MRRVIILGPPGSGKSSLARELGVRTGLPVFHLDQTFWRPGWQQAPASEFAAEVERLASRPDWIIEGNYSATLPPRLQRADTLVYLDVPSWLATFRVVRRATVGWRRTRPDMAEGCRERIDLGFLHFTWTWNRRNRDRYLALATAFGGQSLILRNPGMDAGLRALETG